ncbi:CDP-glucose 4,6-dehydratase [Paenibacillus montanisoli]|nr:CDP-glucose 4,6-dehydratase [Paenibacillus montanisoli]
MSDYAFWQGKRVFVTGHTGFVGTWLSLWLHRLGAAAVIGYSDDMPTAPSMYRLCGMEHTMPWVRGDIRDVDKLTAALREARPDIVFHLAGQSEHGGLHPTVEAIAVNVVGTASLLEAVRVVNQEHPIRAVIAVTAADCYAPRELGPGYRESDSLGGGEPGSAGKAGAELVVSAFRRAYFAGRENVPAVATVRAGHLIGGGDFARGRLVPDCVRAAADLRAAQPAAWPGGFRPWLHVLDALAGCLALAQRLFPPGGGDFAEAWNLGPRAGDARTAAWLAEAVRTRLGGQPAELAAAIASRPNGGDAAEQPMAPALLDTTKAALRLGWRQRWEAEQSAQHAADWYAAWMKGAPMRDVTVSQIAQFEK